MLHVCMIFIWVLFGFRNISSCLVFSLPVSLSTPLHSWTGVESYGQRGLPRKVKYIELLEDQKPSHVR